MSLCLFLPMLNVCIQGTIHPSPKVSLSRGWSEFRVSFCMWSCNCFTCTLFYLYLLPSAIFLPNHLQGSSAICWNGFHPFHLEEPCVTSKLSQHIPISWSFMFLLNSKSENSTLCDFTADIPPWKSLISYLLLFSLPELVILSIFFIWMQLSGVFISTWWMQNISLNLDA